MHTLFNFPLMNMKELRPAVVRENQKTRLAGLPPGAWPANTLGNHDRPRSIQAHGDGENDPALARVSVAMLLTLRGTPFLYYGEEIGMRNLLLDTPAQIRDRVSLWVYRAAIARGDSEQAALDLAVRYGRDQCRTPMQWADAPNGGFCPAGVQPWLPVNPDRACGTNVADQIEDNDSMLNYYRALLRVRKENPALQVGDFQPLQPDRESYLAYLRHSTTHRQTCLVVLNFSAERLQLSFPEIPSKLRCLFSTHRSPRDLLSCERISLAAYEILIGECALSK